ncbi:MAG: nucleotidyltransferase domain-containing protein [candidate division Zixibacteria bacterium]|nr:nucleotidyltransferase domain-containing protein [candidate division Zixibacteria bacterium]
MGIDSQTITEILDRLLAAANPLRIILFGSAATGQMTADSDIDLLVIEGNPVDTRQESIRLRNALRGLGYPFDVIVMAADRFEETKMVVGGIAYPAHKYGKVIYEAT